MVCRLFSDFDDDKNQVIQRTELKQFIDTLQFGVSLDHDPILDAIINDFDKDANSSIHKKEFVDGFMKWIEKAIHHDPTPTIKDSKRAIAKFEEVTHKKWFIDLCLKCLSLIY